MLVIPVGKVFCANITPNSRAFFIALNEPSDFPLKFLGQITLEGKICLSGSPAHDLNAETRSRSHYTTKVIEIIQPASCLKNPSLAGFCMPREINRLAFWFIKGLSPIYQIVLMK